MKNYIYALTTLLIILFAFSSFRIQYYLTFQPQYSHAKYGVSSIIQWVRHRSLLMERESLHFTDASELESLIGLGSQPLRMLIIFPLLL